MRTPRERSTAKSGPNPIVTTGVSRILPAEPVMYFPAGFSGRGERELVGMDLDIDEEEMCIVFSTRGTTCGMQALIWSSIMVLLLQQEGDEFFVPFRYSQSCSGYLLRSPCHH